jgi:hypothetical protein
MEEDVEEYKDPKLKDIAYNWVDSSVFLFYLEVFCIIALLLGGSYGLYTHRYKGKPEIIVPANTQYTPEYK